MYFLQQSKQASNMNGIIDCSPLPRKQCLPNCINLININIDHNKGGRERATDVSIWTCQRGQPCTVCALGEDMANANPCIVRKLKNNNELDCIKAKLHVILQQTK